MKILWIGGWAISPESMRLLVTSRFPKHAHLCIHPHQEFEDTITEYQPDKIVGYSLGATLLLNTPSYLITPFINVKNATWIDNTQIKYLLKWLKKDPVEAINDFYKRAGLIHSKVTNLTMLPYSLDDLIWGIEVLIKTQELSISNVSEQILVGSKDPLINPDFFLKKFPNVTTTIPNADHNLEHYLNTLPFYAV